MNLERNLRRYLNGDGTTPGRAPDARYASFDYCYNYFRSFHEGGRAQSLASDSHIQLSCLHLGFYLASWGMLRGSADLLQRSARYLVPIIEVVAAAPRSLWAIDAHKYSDDNIDRLLAAAQELRRARPGMSDILVTKIMLGVYGNVPALDKYVKKGIGVSTFGEKSLRAVRELYRANAALIDRSRVRTLHFVTGKPTRRRYTRAKVIDMACFIEGRR